MKKTTVTLLCTLYVYLSFATTFYVSNIGNDANDGTSPSTPWLTLAKVNASMASIQPGDTLSFNCGSIFYGSLVCTKSGTASKRIVINSYGSGALPVLTGFIAAGNFKPGNDANILQYYDMPIKPNLTTVLVNGVLQAKGRYPNANAANGGYITYQKVNATKPYIVSNGFGSTSQWAGCQLVIKKKRWIIDVCQNLDSNKVDTFYYRNPTGTENTYFGIENFGYFITNHFSTLDAPGEWYATGSSLFVHNAANAPVLFSNVDTVVNFGTSQYITMQGIAITGGNTFNVYAKNGGYITLIDNSITNTGGTGMYIWNIPGFIAQGNTITNALNNGLYIGNKTTQPTTVRYNTFKNIATLPGMAQSGDSKSHAAYIWADNLLFEYNSIDSVGYNGLQFQGSNVLVKNNFVKNYCLTTDDGGGIYTWYNDGKYSYTNRAIIGNVLINGAGCANGTDRATSIDCRAIYLDGGTANVNINGNTVGSCSGASVYLNNTVNVQVANNTFYNANVGVSMQRFRGSPLLRNNTIVGNIFFPLSATQKNIFYWNGQLNVPTVTSIVDDFRAIGRFDSNTYRNDVAAPFDYFFHLTDDGNFFDPPALSFAQWQPFINADAASKVLRPFTQLDSVQLVYNATRLTATTPLNENYQSIDSVDYVSEITLPPYSSKIIIKADGNQPYTVVSGNMFSNGQFTTSINYVSITSANRNHAAMWDKNKEFGNCLLLTANDASLTNFTSISKPIGVLNSKSSYILRFKIKGNSSGGFARTYLRKKSTVATFLSDIKQWVISDTVQQKEFLFTAPTTDLSASIYIDIRQNSGPVYIDDVQFFQVKF